MPVEHTPKVGQNGRKEDENEKENNENDSEKKKDENENDDNEDEDDSDSDDEDPLKLLIYKRGQVKAKVTRLRNTLRSERGRISLPRVQVMQRNLLTFYDEYSKHHDEVLDNVNKKGRKSQETKYEEFEELYTNTLVDLQALEIQLSNPVVPSTSRGGTDHVVVHQQSLKAPLPTFDGRYENWPKFKSMFLDLMRDSRDSDAVKLYHLEKSLVGSASGVIDIKTINDNNYGRAWKLLEDRFENKRNIIDTHIRGLNKLKKMTRESYSELRELVEECTRHVDNLEFMGQQLQGVSELMVVNQLSDALDAETKKLWEATLECGELPTYKATIDFLKKRCHILERCQTSNPETTSQSKPKPAPKGAIPKNVTKSHAATAQQTSDGFACHLCNKTHQTFRCDEFRALSIEERFRRAKELNICFNCLRKGHRLADCKSKKGCMVCKARHNTLLHSETPSSGSVGSKERSNKSEGNSTASKNETRQPKAAPPPSRSNESSESIVCSHIMPQPSGQVMLMTAVVGVFDINRKLHPCRAFIDPGSMSHMVSAKLANRLGLPTTPAFVTVSGINGTRSTAEKRMAIEFQSRTSEFRANISCLVLEKVTGPLPLTSIDSSSWGIPLNFELADPEFQKSADIDLLIGCGLFWQLLVPGTLKIGNNLPELHNSKLGWLVSGEFYGSDEAAEAVVHSNAAIVSNLDCLIQKFWEIEEVPGESSVTSEEEFCEGHFQISHTRNDDGRFVVSLPFKENLKELGDSREQAVKRFFMLEKRFCRCPDFKEQYVTFINEYRNLEHCREVDESKDPPDLQTYYLPHHAVLRPSSSTTKLRVVFDASAKSSSGVSLNDVLQVGGVVQSDLFSIVLRFRRHPIVFTADLTKMYRQVRVKDEDCRFQRIVWRENSTDPLKVYELATVTYGTAAAPYLATRALKQLAEDERQRYPDAAEIVENDFYVDDVLSGADSVQEAISRRTQLKELLALGGFPIHKWSSNSPEVLENIPEEEREKPVGIASSANEVIKALGLFWSPTTDEFTFVVPYAEQVEAEKITKRYVLSQIARLFDPLGLLSPLIVVAKLLMQRLWANGIDWDEQLPENLQSAWSLFASSLPSVSALRIPRCVVGQGVKVVELHGFSDASELAYGACLYLRCVQDNGEVSSQLLCSKSKVAPLKELTIPRKELCAALLLCRLLQKVVPALQMEIQKIVLWSDSQVVLAWLKKSPGQVQVFVRNRVKEINETSGQFNAEWNYIHTSENPADVVSRGQLAEALQFNTLWWIGPSFLRSPEYSTSPVEQLSDKETPELRNVVCSAAVVERVLPVFTKYSSFRKLQRVLGWVLRFSNNAREKDPTKRATGTSLTIPEMRAALERIVLVVQQLELGDEIERIQHDEPCRRIANLSPIYQNGLLRVGGRLERSNLNYNARHQLILPDRNPVVKLLIRALHEENLHVGPSGLAAALRQRFWVLNARSEARQITRSCVTCFKAKPRGVEQQMGNLPECRVTPSMPFAKTGVDFAGPVYLRHGTRKPTFVKGYIAVFVCMAVKAVHLELVSDLTAATFIAALHRFVGHHGVPEEIHSDHGLNFVGANNELRELRALFEDQQTKDLLDNFCQPREIVWRFIPPRAPHFGGLWEANVKCVKSHLKKILKTTSLNFEEYATVLVQIQAVLNSRPLFTHSSDPKDPAVITPGHFLIGRELTAIPEPSREGTKVGRLPRWKYIQTLREHFWKRWSSEYLYLLQTREKWRAKQPNVKKGTVVVLKDDNLPVQSWKLGVIEETYPGRDGAVRVVEVRTAQGVFRRPITKICPLPIETEDTTSDAETLDVPARTAGDSGDQDPAAES